MEEVTFNRYLNSDVEDTNLIFDFYLNFLDNFSTNTFPYPDQLKLKGAGGKFINSVESKVYLRPEKKEMYYELLDRVNKDLKVYRRFFRLSPLHKYFVESRSSRLLRVQYTFQELYSLTVELINEATNKNYIYDELEVNGFYKPDNSNKNRITELINEAIDLIRDDSTLTEKSKKSIIDYLEKALRELNRERVNWNKFIGRIKEVIIVLGALGSVAAGASTIFSAKEKLEETTVIIQKTSINFNLNVLNDTFNIQNIANIASINSLLELPEGVNDKNEELIEDVEFVEDNPNDEENN